MRDDPHPLPNPIMGPQEVLSCPSSASHICRLFQAQLVTLSVEGCWEAVKGTPSAGKTLKVNWDQPFFREEYHTGEAQGPTLLLPHSSADWFT